jgi:FMN reductase
MSARTLVVVSAGLSQPSTSGLLAGRLADATVAALARHPLEAQVHTIELRAHAHELTDNLLTSFASEKLQAAKDRVAGADGLIAVTPIYSASYSGLFKTFFDLLDDGALAGIPTLIGATAGTARHSLALEHAVRPLFAYLGALTSPTAVFAASEDWGADGTIDGGLAARSVRAADTFAALVAAREPTTPTDPFADLTPFARLLDAN